MKPRLGVAAGVVLAWLAAATPLAAQPLTAAITYQGRLQQSGTPLDSTADFEFRLFDALTGGAQLGSTNPVSNVNVVNGVFTATLNFGSGPFNGNQRWLEIAVRSPTGMGSFTPLTPRQALTVTPFALYALSGPGSGSSWGVSGTNIFNTNTGNVGIGTTTPSAPLHIASDPFAVIMIQDTGPASTQAGYVSYRNNAMAETGWVGYGTPGSPHFSISNARPGGDVAIFTGTGGSVRLATNVTALTVTSAGNVGIGTETPAAKLDVRGNIRLGNSGEYFAPAAEENLRIVRGVIGPGGVITAGSGFSLNVIETGRFLITFTPPFSNVPSVSGMARVGGAVQLKYNNLTSTSVEFITTIDSTSVEGVFTFIAIGPR